MRFCSCVVIIKPHALKAESLSAIKFNVIPNDGAIERINLHADFGCHFALWSDLLTCERE